MKNIYSKNQVFTFKIDRFTASAVKVLEKVFFSSKKSGKSNNWVLPCNPADTVPQCCYLRTWIYFTILIRKNLAFILGFKICLLRPWNWLRKVEKWTNLPNHNKFLWMVSNANWSRAIYLHISSMYFTLFGSEISLLDPDLSKYNI